MTYGLQLLEMAHVAEQEHMQKAMMARARRLARRGQRRDQARRIWAALWPFASNDLRTGSRVALSSNSGDALCSEC